MFKPKTILCATDFSPCAAAAVACAADLARSLQAALVLVHVLPNPALLFPGPDLAGVLPDIIAAVQQQADAELQKVRRGISGIDVRTVLREGPVHDAILGAAGEAKADLLVVGTHGRTGVKHLLLGSVAERIVRLSSVPVLTVRGNA